MNSTTTIVSMGSSRCRMSRRASASSPKAAVDPELLGGMEDEEEIGPIGMLAAVDNNAAFPSKLRTMLDDAGRGGFEHIVSWQPNGEEFKVHDADAFVKQVMPLYFNQSKYKSFQRQCNLYGFLRILEGESKGGYAHPSFNRSDPLLAQTICREKAVTKSAIVSPKKKKAKKQASAAIKKRLMPPTSKAPAAKRSKKSPAPPPAPTSDDSCSSRRSTNGTVYQVIPESPRSVDAVKEEQQCVSDRVNSSFLSPSGSPVAVATPTAHTAGNEVHPRDNGEKCDGEDTEEGDVTPASLLDEFDIDPLFSFFAVEGKNDAANVQQGGDSSIDIENNDSVCLPQLKMDREEQKNIAMNGTSHDSRPYQQLSLPQVKLLPRAPPSAPCMDATDHLAHNAYHQQSPVPISPCGRRNFVDRSPPPIPSDDTPPACFTPPLSFYPPTPYFPYKLFDMLDHADRYGFRNTVSWLEDGQSFRIHDHHDFCMRIMPYYLDGLAQYDSFRRQLGQHGFIPGNIPGTYSHPNFYYGDRSCCERVLRMP